MRKHPDQKQVNPKVDYFCDKVVAAWREEGKKRGALAESAEIVERRKTEKKIFK